MNNLFQQAYQLQSAGQLEEALQLYQQELEQHPDHSDTLYLCGVIYGQQKSYHQAIECIEKAIQLNPQQPIYFYNLANSYKAINEFETAIIHYKKALALNPEYGEVYYQLGKLLKDMDFFGDARQFLTQAIHYKPEEYRAHYHLGEIAQERQNFQQAILAYQKVLELKPKHTDTHCNLGLTYQNLGEMTQAIAHYQEALKGELSTQTRASLGNNLGNIYRERGEVKLAVACYQQALKAEPDFVDAIHNLGCLLDKYGEREQAIPYFQQALTLEPAIDTYCHLARLWKEAYEYDKAHLVYQQALQFAPDSLAVQFGLAEIYLELEQFEEALNIYDKLIELTPPELAQEMAKLNNGEISRNSTEAHHILNQLIANAGKAMVYEGRSRYQEAYEWLKPLISSDFYNLDVGIAYATLCLRLKKPAEAIPYLEALNQLENLLFHKRRDLYFKLGELYDKTAQPKQAFENYKRGNQLKPHGFSLPHFKNKIEQLKQFFSAEILAAMPRANLGSRRPIFVVGAPRSGTTLTEQILASHRDVYGAGELSDLRQILGRHTHNHDNLAANFVPLNQRGLNQLAQEYLDALNVHSPYHQHIVDKMPANNLYMGFIELLFPQAKVIHCQRHPIDNCLACYFQNFTNLEYSNDLESLGHFYGLQYTLMEQYREVLSLEVLDWQYEEVVANPEAKIRELIDFVELPWDDNCLQYFNIKRHVKTPSASQVIQPIYTTSVNRYKPYESYLEPLITILKKYNLP